MVFGNCGGEYDEIEKKKIFGWENLKLNSAVWRANQDNPCTQTNTHTFEQVNVAYIELKHISFKTRVYSSSQTHLSGNTHDSESPGKRGSFGDLICNSTCVHH